MALLSGTKRSATLLESYAQAVEKLKERGITPKLVVITVGEDPASKVYVGQKEKKSLSIGMAFDWVKLPETTTQAELNQTIDDFNADDNIYGMIVQFPLPAHLDKNETVSRIRADKDVDGFHPENIGKLALNQGVLFPCTPKGILDLLMANGISVSGKDVVVIGRSHVVGMPLSIMLINLGATVTVCNRSTKDRDKYTKDADIIIAAAGTAGLLGASQVKEGAVIVDVGMNRSADGQLVGDVLFDELQDKASWITPVPGGVGPMTVAMLLEQTIVCACVRHGLDSESILGRA
ncbi:MAG: bifunctional 5,10-methylenetetrahydrofolate dehydrogenase/5,10-methenyltetrahydrofolate cyclohydrolase [Aerococcaceae bacterium]|nr:bifunctional 5,10-methylenetetrahydrofolate dehydrogenase/5,10-methenyltetrahydrofolate cyclohydrolase [Aerococcaceae bacterium]